MEGGGDRWGQPDNGTKKKRKGGGEVGCRGRGSWVGWARMKVRSFFFFFFKLFSN
jgi:hypothetical protein